MDKQLPYYSAVTFILQSSSYRPYEAQAHTVRFEERAAEVNETAYELLDNIENSWLKEHKPKNPGSFTEQLQLRTQARMMADEIVLADVVMQFH